MFIGKFKLCVFSLQMNLWTHPLLPTQQDRVDRHPSPKEADGHPCMFAEELNLSPCAMNYKETEAPVSVNKEMPVSKNVKCHEKRKFPRMLLVLLPAKFRGATTQNLPSFKTQSSSPFQSYGALRSVRSLHQSHILKYF